MKYNNIILKAVAQIIIGVAVILAMVLLAAGRIDYWQGWVYAGVNLIVLLSTQIVLRDHPELIRERLKPGQGMKSWDKIYFALSTPLYLIAIIIAGLDAGRYKWGPDVGWPVFTAAVLIYLAAQAVFLWAKSVNKFLSSVARIQTDRGQTVCREGPYRFIRHPSYMAGILFGLTGPLILGSWWGMIPQAAAALLLIIRTAFEDNMLRKELPGYMDYTEEVKYRLLPGIW